MNLLFFFMLVLFWGCSFIAIRESLHTFPPFMAAGMRISLGMLLLWIYALIKKKRNTLSGKVLGQQLFLGLLFFGFPWAFLFWGEQYVHPSIASIINSTVPIFVLILSWLMLPDERPSVPTIIGVSLGFVGMFYVFFPGNEWKPELLQVKIGMLSIFLMAIAYGFAGVLFKRWSRGVDMLWALIVQALSASIFLACLSLVAGEKISNTENILRSSIGIVYLAVCSTAIASLIYYRLLFEWGALKAVAVTYLSPFVAIFVDMVFLHIRLQFHEIAGGMLIMAGILLIHWSKVSGSIRRVRPRS